MVSGSEFDAMLELLFVGRMTCRSPYIPRIALSSKLLPP